MYKFKDLKVLSQTQETLKNQYGWSENFLKRHHLVGMAYRKSGDKKYYSDWKRQLTKNFLVRDELERLGKDFQAQGVDVCLLKGFSLMGDVYEDWGERFASDVDVLVNLGNLWRLSDILKLHGFQKVLEKKWLGNRFKFLYFKKVGGIEVNIEVHTQMFWHRTVEWSNGARGALIPGFLNLDKETQLMHLCGHLAFQHTFLKLFWLVDIFKFVQRHKKSIHWPRFWSLSLQFGLYKSSFLSLHLCQSLGLDIQMELSKAPQKYGITLKVLKKIVTLSFLHDPRKKPLRYFLVKNLVKDSLWLNGTYTLGWIKEKWRQKVRS